MKEIQNLKLQNSELDQELSQLNEKLNDKNQLILTKNETLQESDMKKTEYKKQLNDLKIKMYEMVSELKE